MSLKTLRTSLVALIFLASIVLSANVLPAQAAAPFSHSGQEGTPSPEAGAPALEDTPPADTPTGPQPTPTPSYRPILVLESSSVDPNPVVPGSNFTMKVRINNGGHKDESDPMLGAFAFNVEVTFKPGTFLPVDVGGIHAIPEIDAGQAVEVVQTFNAPTSLYGQTSATQEVTVSYTDRSGTAYSDSFTIGVPVKNYWGGPASPTATPTAVMRPQLVISGYNTDVVTLQPGAEFTLNVEIRNLGTANARSVTMIMGGGSASSSVDGTPQPGGVDGGGGEFTSFAPLKSSNIQFVGDILSGEAAQAQQPLIVNVSTNPGAYSVKFSFIYTDDKGAHYTDAQVITLLVYSLPMLEVSFYQDPGVFMVGQPGPLPIQLSNLSRKSTVLGTMKITAPEGAQVMNDTGFVGPLDPAGYFTMDAQLIPDKTGPLELTLNISYIDDFNKPRTYTLTKTVEVIDAPVIEPPINGETGEPIPGGDFPIVEPTAPETFWQKTVRFLKGMIGLDSSIPTPDLSGFPGDGGMMEGPAGMNSSGGKPIMVQPAPIKGP